MRKICDSVWIGNSSDSRDEAELMHCGIGAVLNVAQDLDTVQYEHLPSFKAGLKDGSWAGNAPLVAMDLLDLLVRRFGIVLVHCHGGKSRSPFVVARWLREVEDMDWDIAASIVGLEFKEWMREWTKW